MLIHVQKGKYRYAYSVLGMELSFLVIQSIFFFFFSKYFLKKYISKEPLFFAALCLPVLLNSYSFIDLCHRVGSVGR